MHDFTWAELGCRIRDRRIKKGLSQQALADNAGITQAGLARIETGQTNPQLETLRQIATALGCSARDLVIGISDSNPALADRFLRVRRVIESGDDTAIRALDNGIETAEALLERRGGRRGMPPIRLKGEGRRSQAEDLLWMKGPQRRRSEIDDNAVAHAVRKAGKPFRNSGTRHETKNR